MVFTSFLFSGYSITQAVEKGKLYLCKLDAPGHLVNMVFIKEKTPKGLFLEHIIRFVDVASGIRVIVAFVYVIWEVGFLVLVGSVVNIVDALIFAEINE